MKEETMPYANVKSGVMDIADSAVRDQINQLLAGVTNMKFVTPYIALERVAKTLANFHIYLPSQGFLEGDSGAASWPIHQYGAKIGQTNDGEVVTTPSAQFSVFFEYRMSDCGMFMVFCEVVDQDELEEIMDDLEAELNDESEEEELDEGYVSYRIVSKDAGKGTYDKFGDMKPGTRTIGNKRQADKDNESDKKEKSEKTSAAEKKARFDEESGYYYGKQKIAELKMSDEQQLDEISAEKVGKLKTAVDLAGKKLKTAKAKETLEKRHKKEWLKSKVGVMKEDEQLDEVSKKTLASYIKKASHDVATKSAATGRYAERANKEEDKRKKEGDYSGYQQGRKDSKFADKMFAKSWKRREGIAKAADKLAKEETEINEISDKLKARYVNKAEKDKAHAERQADHSETIAKYIKPERKEAFKKEAEWLRGIAAKRAKGIASAKK